LVEKIGSGINKIRCVLRDKVRFENEGDGFRVIIKRDDRNRMLLEDTQGTVEKTVVEKILQLIKENPKITQRQLSEATGLSRRGIEWHIKTLKEKGRLKRIGPDKGGYWEVIE